ncbi:hypothetical protein [Deinococcus roseus]|nr:hypothetical protein [Deinococcus roseus]
MSKEDFLDPEDMTYDGFNKRAVTTIIKTYRDSFIDEFGRTIELDIENTPVQEIVCFNDGIEFDRMILLDNVTRDRIDFYIRSLKNRVNQTNSKTRTWLFCIDFETGKYHLKSE